MAAKFAFVVAKNDLDLEERFEAVSMALALRDAGLDLRLVFSENDARSDELVIGRGQRQNLYNPLHAPIHDSVARYWENPVIARHMGRKFEVCDLRRARQLRDEWGGIFLKSTREKEYVQAIPADANWYEELGGIEYSFMDRGHCILAQELLDLKNETRFMIVDGIVATATPQVTDHTPQTAKCKRIPQHQLSLAVKIANEISALKWPFYNLDIAESERGPVVVECNPLLVGQIGLYGTDVNILARSLIRAGVFEHPTPKDAQ